MLPPLLKAIFPIIGAIMSVDITPIKNIGRKATYLSHESGKKGKDIKLVR